LFFDFFLPFLLNDGITPPPIRTTRINSATTINVIFPILELPSILGKFYISCDSKAVSGVLNISFFVLAFCSPIYSSIAGPLDSSGSISSTLPMLKEFTLKNLP
jgi:hypothetical protein